MSENEHHNLTQALIKMQKKKGKPITEKEAERRAKLISNQVPFDRRGNFIVTTIIRQEIKDQFAGSGPSMNTKIN